MTVYLCLSIFILANLCQIKAQNNDCLITNCAVDFKCGSCDSLFGYCTDSVYPGTLVVKDSTCRPQVDSGNQGAVCDIGCLYCYNDAEIEQVKCILCEESFTLMESGCECPAPKVVNGSVCQDPSSVNNNTNSNTNTTNNTNNNTTNNSTSNNTTDPKGNNSTEPTQNNTNNSSTNNSTNTNSTTNNTTNNGTNDPSSNTNNTNSNSTNNNTTDPLNNNNSTDPTIDPGSNNSTTNTTNNNTSASNTTSKSNTGPIGAALIPYDSVSPYLLTVQSSSIVLALAALSLRFQPLLRAYMEIIQLSLFFFTSTFVATEQLRLLFNAVSLAPINKFLSFLVPSDYKQQSGNFIYENYTTDASLIRNTSGCILVSLGIMLCALMQFIYLFEKNRKWSIKNAPNIRILFAYGMAEILLTYFSSTQLRYSFFSQMSDVKLTRVQQCLSVFNFVVFIAHLLLTSKKLKYMLTGQTVMSQIIPQESDHNNNNNIINDHRSQSSLEIIRQIKEQAKDPLFITNTEYVLTMVYHLAVNLVIGLGSLTPAVYSLFPLHLLHIVVQLIIKSRQKYKKFHRILFVMQQILLFVAKIFLFFKFDKPIIWISIASLFVIVAIGECIYDRVWLRRKQARLQAKDINSIGRVSNTESGLEMPPEGPRDIKQDKDSILTDRRAKNILEVVGTFGAKVVEQRSPRQDKKMQSSYLAGAVNSGETGLGSSAHLEIQQL